MEAPGEGEVEVEEASELKSHGNAAYSRNDVEEAVRLWNLAIRKHVQELSDGKPCDEEATTLERSIYLNLAQGYLKLGDGERALRACKVVLFTDQENDKARFRAAEACLQLGRSQEAEQWLSKLDLPEASKMLQRIRWKSRAEAAKDSKQDAAARKKLAEKMSAGLSGFSEDKPPPVPQETVGMTDLDTVSNMTDISAEVAQAAKNRLARMEAAAEGEQPLPEPTYTDFESFRAKAQQVRSTRRPPREAGNKVRHLSALCGLTGCARVIQGTWRTSPPPCEKSCRTYRMRRLQRRSQKQVKMAMQKWMRWTEKKRAKHHADIDLNSR
ncbi:unnamed protein product [Durusdinium trenchii]|uniref:Uncharacterized protein n=1 Tax=Durusdinium trenchii TaxID=1381693 RepID=A0ABP0JH82_9DINO